ncbi:MAG: hypothetical protein ACE5LU_24395 [Anaerolineae bacterium]
MTDEQKTTPEEPRAPSKEMPFTGMMKKMMGRQGGSCDCAGMMAMCCGAQDESEETAKKAAQEV